MQTVAVDPLRCIGCKQCAFACAVEHSATRDPLRAWREQPTPRSRIHVEMGPWMGSAFPGRCGHCDPAPCADACPTGAIGRALDVDVVLVDEAKCIGCASCAMVCPFDAVTFRRRNGGGEVATKCDGCVERRRRGDVPACVETCKTGALVYGEIDEIVASKRARRGLAVLIALAERQKERPHVDASDR